MKNPQKEVERLLKNPVIAKQGVIFVNEGFKTPFIQVVLNSFPGHQHERICMFSPEEWVRLAEVMKVCLAPRKNKSKKKEGC